MDNTLDFIDQASFLGLRALGHGPVIQYIWIYEHSVDLEGLRRFHHNLGRGLLGRRIERSPLPFGRHRWIAWPGPPDIDVAASPRPRAGVSAWIDEQAALPIDPECGPSWRLAVQPIAEGGAAVTLVLSHTVADGVGGIVAVEEAVNGVDRNLSYPGVARPKVSALLADSRQFIREFPAMVRAGVAMVALLRKRADAMSTPTGAPIGRDLKPVVPVSVPSITVYTDAGDWDDRADTLGGTPTSLFIGFTSRLGSRFGWVNGDGLVEITVPVNERTEGDTRGNALTQVSVVVDPTRVCEDLSTVRSDVKAALSTLGEARHELLTPLPLVPVVPKAMARRLERMVIGTGVIGSSNLGEVAPDANRPDGTDADFFAVRMAEALTTADIRRTRGMFFPVVTGRVHGRIFISIGYTNAGGTTTRDELAQRVRETLADFRLTGIVE